jgi:hypothetical protein
MIEASFEYNHPNDVWLEPIRQKNIHLAEGLKLIHSAIFLADDIADRQIMPEMTSHILWQTMLGMAQLIISGDFLPFLLIFQRVHESELSNLTFVPKQLSIEEELERWKTRSVLLDVYFEGLKRIDGDIDTKQNREWFERFKEFTLIHDDCMDILDGVYEDLNLCRRNYVVLKRFGLDGYFEWKNKVPELISAAQEIKQSLVLDEPADARLKIFTFGRKDNA